MVIVEEYELACSLYEADEMLEATLMSAQLQSLQESSNLLLNEAAADIVSNYIKKIIPAIQKAWDKFKENVVNTKLKYKEEEITEAIEKYPPIVKVKDYVTYDIDKLTKMTYRQFDWNTMKDHLDTDESFMRTYYSNIYSDSGKSIEDNLRNTVTGDKQAEYSIKKEDLQSMYDYMKDHKSTIDEIGKNLDAVNKSADSAQFIARSIGESVSFAINEAEDNPKPTVVSAKGPEENSSSDDTKKEDSQKTVKKIQKYFDCTTKILSAQMKISREIFFFYNSVIEAHMKNVQKEQAEKKAKEEADKAQENGETSTKLKV